MVPDNYTNYLVSNYGIPCTMSTIVTQLALRLFPEQPDKNRFRKVCFPNWLYRETNPRPPHIKPTEKTTGPPRSS